MLAEIAAVIRSSRDALPGPDGASKFTQNHAAEFLGIGLRTYIAWEQSGKVPPGRRAEVAELLRLNPETLDPDAVATLVGEGPGGNPEVLTIHPSGLEGLSPAEAAELTHYLISELYAKKRAIERDR